MFSILAPEQKKDPFVEPDKECPRDLVYPGVFLSRKGYNYEDFVPEGILTHGCHGWIEYGSYEFIGIKRHCTIKSSTEFFLKN